MPPKVSVLVPTYNRAQYLGEAVQSALQQTYQDLEVIVVDDGSTDHTAEIIRAITDPRLRYTFQENRGVASALNTAARLAQGEYVAMLGSDDRWNPELLATLTPRLEEEPTLGVVYARAQGMDANGQPLPQLLGAPQKFPGQPLPSLLYGDCVCAIAAVIRRTCLEQVGGFDESLHANEDWDLWIRLAEHTRFAYVPLVLAQYRMHADSLTSGHAERYEKVLLDRLRLIERYYARPTIPRAAFAVKALALRNVHMDVTIRNLAVGRWRAAWHFFRKTLQVAPNPLTTTLRLLAVAIFDLWLSKTDWGVQLVERLVAFQRRKRNAPHDGSSTPSAR